MGQPLFLYPAYSATAVTVSTSSVKSGTAAANVLEPTEDTCWQPASTAGWVSLTFDFGAAKAFSVAAIVGAYLDGVSLEIRGSTDNFIGSSVVVRAGASLDADCCAAFAEMTEATYRYWRLNFAALGSSSKVTHVIFADVDQCRLPYFSDGVDLEALEAEAKPLISAAGYYLGSAHNRTMRNYKLDFGQVDASEAAVFRAWAAACVDTPRAFVFVPDEEQATAHLVWQEKPSFSMPQSLGLYRVGTIDLTGRA